VLDAILGFSLAGPPSGAAAALIRAANAHHGPVLSIDLPSGLDATSGAVFDPCIQATATLTLALPKTGLFADTARSVVGELYAADIGVPPEAILSLGVDVDHVFAESDIIRLP